MELDCTLLNPILVCPGGGWFCEQVIIRAPKAPPPKPKDKKPKKSQRKESQSNKAANPRGNRKSISQDNQAPNPRGNYKKDSENNEAGNPKSKGKKEEAPEPKEEEEEEMVWYFPVNAWMDRGRGNGEIKQSVKAGPAPEPEEEEGDKGECMHRDGGCWSYWTTFLLSSVIGFVQSVISMVQIGGTIDSLRKSQSDKPLYFSAECPSAWEMFLSSAE